MGSERWIAWGFVELIDGGGLYLVTVLVEQLPTIALPDCVSEVIDQIEDREGLFGRPVGWDLQGDGEGQAGCGLSHDLVLRRFWARRSDRSCASLRR